MMKRVQFDQEEHCFMVKYQQESIYKGSLLMHKFLLVPGSDERKIHKSISVGADCVVYDLEDSVSSNKKGTARHMVIDALEVKNKKVTATNLVIYAL
jgi:hypothetical protein